MARRDGRLRARVEECRLDAPASSWIAGDLGERAFARRVVDETLERYGRIDVLVNNAALPLHRLILETSFEQADRTLRINLQALHLDDSGGAASHAAAGARAGS